MRAMPAQPNISFMHENPDAEHPQPIGHQIAWPAEELEEGLERGAFCRHAHEHEVCPEAGIHRKAEDKIGTCEGNRLSKTSEAGPKLAGRKLHEDQGKHQGMLGKATDDRP